jgi:hypothetical protein
MKKSTDIEFLSNYWIEAKRLATHIQNNLHKGITPNKAENYNGQSLMRVINYSDLQNWDPKHHTGDSLTLKILGDKLSYMIDMDRSNDIEPMLRKIITGRVKKHYTHYSKLSGTKDPIGLGHFRWDYQAHTLTDVEIKRVKEFFKL